MFFTVSPSTSLSPYFLHLLSACICHVDGVFEDNDSRGREQNKEGKKGGEDKGLNQGHVTEMEREVSRTIYAVNQAKLNGECGELRDHSLVSSLGKRVNNKRPVKKEHRLFFIYQDR